MNIIQTPLKGLFVVELEKKVDNRGYFARAWCKKEFSDSGLNDEFVQFNISHNENRGTTRGLHYQIEPLSEVKFVRCTKGKIFDVAVDIRTNSETYGMWFGIELSEENGKGLYIPDGFAHGYQTLEDDTYVFYQVSQVYSFEHERGIIWNDKNIGIKWPINDNIIISEKDQSLNCLDYKELGYE